ncbi:hypothetical protein ACLB2K_065077 [Fragaria x ananassa]
MKRHNAKEHGGSMSRSRRSAALQIPVSFLCRRSNEDNHRELHAGQHGSDVDAEDNQLSLTVQASVDTANAERLRNTSSTVQAVFDRRGASDSGIIASGFESLATTETESSVRCSNALRENSRNVLAEESAFPPLPLAQSSRQQKFRNGSERMDGSTMASRSNTATINWTMPSGYATPGPERQAAANGFVPSNFLSTGKSPSTSRVGDVQTANKSLHSLVEKIRDALEFDENKFTTFKELSGKYRKDLINTGEYLACVDQFGLSHLVLELAQLCPDAEKKRELVETYNFNMKSSGSHGKSKSSSKKGKEKCVDNGTTSSKDALKLNCKPPVEDAAVVLKNDCHSSKGKLKKALEDDEINLDSGNYMPIALAELGDAEIGPDLIEEKTDRDKDPPEGLPVRGVWQNGGGRRLVNMTMRNRPKLGVV